MNFIPLSVAYILFSVPVLLFGLTVFLKSSKLKLKSNFLFLCLSIFIWLLLYGLIGILPESYARWYPALTKIVYSSIALIPFFVLGIIVSFFNVNKYFIFTIFLYLIVSISLIVKSNLIIDGFYLYPWGIYPKAGIYHPLFLATFLSLVIVETYLMTSFILKNQSKSTKELNQTKYFFLALLIFSIASLDFIPNYGINFFPIGYLPSTIFIIITGYAIIKHNLMDIYIVISRGVVYSILFTLFSIIYVLIIFILEKFTQITFGYTRLSISITIIFLFGISLMPIRHLVQNLLDNLLYKGSRDFISKQNEQLRNELAQVDKYRTLAALSSGVAHEIKNPLTAIKTFSEYLPKKINDKQFLIQFSRIVGYEVDRINALVHQLMEYGKPTPLTLKKANIYKLLNDGLDIFNSHFIDKKINVNRLYPQMENYSLNIDPNQIKQALMNIILNAIEAMSYRGELTVTALKEKNTYFCVRIKDTGKGISQKDLPHIFDPFYTSKDMNTGLGLSITQTIIEQHKGKIKVKSTVGVGTEFTVMLPLTV